METGPVFDRRIDLCVHSITAYRRELEEINSSMSCGLTVSGSGLELLKPCDFLAG